MVTPLLLFGTFAAGAASGAAASHLWSRRKVLSMAHHLHRALARNEFVLRYQPIVRLSERSCIGAEALIRLRNHDGTLIGPDAFIPLAEQSGLMPAITDRVVQLVVSELGDFLRRHPDLHVAINVPPAVLDEGGMRDAVERHGLLPLCPQVIVEITETGTLDERGRRAVAFARSMHARVAIDDFGTGTNDLAQLQDLQVDFIKIDKSFIRKIGSRAPGARLVDAIVTVARDVGAKTIAEGVETDHQASYLSEIGADYGQGYLFSEPLTARRLGAYIAAEASTIS